MADYVAILRTFHLRTSFLQQAWEVGVIVETAPLLQNPRSEDTCPQSQGWEVARGGRDPRSPGSYRPGQLASAELAGRNADGDAPSLPQTRGGNPSNLPTVLCIFSCTNGSQISCGEHVVQWNGCRRTAARKDRRRQGRYLFSPMRREMILLS